MEDILEWIVKYPKLAERLEARPADKDRVKKYLTEMKAEFSWSTIKYFRQLLDQVMMPLYDEIGLQVPEDMDLQKLADENCLVFVPNHQSHADYLAISYKLAGTDYHIPLHITAGINLNIFPIGQMFRKAGAFFIRRSLGSDVLYKLTLEAYVGYLLHNGTPLEFFFEGGRSRTGKLMPPKYGMFSMILSAYKTLGVEKKPLLFIPVSIVHELLPEEKTHAQELGGAKKKKENTKELFKLFKMLDRRFGSIHINVGHPLLPPAESVDPRDATQTLAFETLRSVAKGLLVTPTAVLAMVMLDEPTGAMTLDDLMVKSHKIVSYCQRFNIGLSKSLSPERRDRSLKRAFEILISNKKVQVLPNERLEQTYYVIKEENRVHLLYSKNTILHHFLTPFFINSAWIKVFNGTAKTEQDLGKLFLDQRKRLKHEFYLPTVKELRVLALEIVTHYTGKELNRIEDGLHLDREDMYKLMSNINVFSRSCLFIFEAYYVAALTLKHLFKIHGDEGFKKETYIQASKEIFALEKNHGRMIRYPESYSIPLMDTAFIHFIQSRHVKPMADRPGFFMITDIAQVNTLVHTYLQDLTERLSFNLNLIDAESRNS